MSVGCVSMLVAILVRAAVVLASPRLEETKILLRPAGQCTRHAQCSVTVCSHAAIAVCPHATRQTSPRALHAPVAATSHVFTTLAKRGAQSRAHHVLSPVAGSVLMSRHASSRVASLACDFPVIAVVTSSCPASISAPRFAVKCAPQTPSSHVLCAALSQSRTRRWM